MSEIPACPKCSNRGYLVRPSWYYAQMTSAKRGRDHWIWHGCDHARAISTTNPVDEAGRVEVEKRWSDAVPGLLKARIEVWTDEQGAEFVRVLGGDRFELPPPPPFELEPEEAARAEPEVEF